MILTQNFNLDIVKPSLNRLRLVNGDTANQFIITIKNNGASVTLDTSLHKIIAVFTRSDGQVYTQDANNGLTFTTGGVVTIDVYPSSFCTGTNKITLQIYKRENSSATTYPLLLTTQEQSFTARAAAIPEAGASNAPSQLPMLEQLISDATTATANCTEATNAAQDAAYAANQAATAATAAMPVVINVRDITWNEDYTEGHGYADVDKDAIMTAVGNGAIVMMSVPFENIRMYYSLQDGGNIEFSSARLIPLSTIHFWFASLYKVSSGTACHVSIRMRAVSAT